MSKILLIDTMNFAHRARAGFGEGDHSIIFNFFRNLRALIELIKPDEVMMILEGHPKARHEAHPEYKANRRLDEASPGYDAKRAAMIDFHRQIDAALFLIKSTFPIQVVRHPDHECDDVLAYWARRYANAQHDVVVASSDTDFIQLLHPLYSRISLYNPMRKEWIVAPLYPYLTWKALKGDSSDNISGIKGCGEKTASRLASDPKLLEAYLSDPQKLLIWERNVSLIEFHELSIEDLDAMERWFQPVPDWDTVHKDFEARGFTSIINPKSWAKFTTTFEAAVTRTQAL